ncbi:MAG: hypothetical protein WC122_01960 [archaeon]
MERFSLKDLSIQNRISLLRELGYDSDGKFVLDSQGKHVKDKYIGIDVMLENMLILPGSTLVLDNNPISISEYIEEYNKDL